MPFVSLSNGLLPHAALCSFSNLTAITLFYHLHVFSLENKQPEKVNGLKKSQLCLCGDSGIAVYPHVLSAVCIALLNIWINFLLIVHQSLTKVKLMSALARMFSESLPVKTTSLSGKINTLAFSWFTDYFLCLQH